MIEQTLFPVKEYPAYHEAGTWAKSDENENLNNTGYKFIVREDTGKVLSCMTNDYKLVNNKQIIDTATPILKQHKAELKEAVSLGDGQKTVWKWIIPDVKMKVAKDDFMNPEIIIKNSYDGSMQVHILSGGSSISGPGNLASG